MWHLIIKQWYKTWWQDMEIAPYWRHEMTSSLGKKYKKRNSHYTRLGNFVQCKGQQNMKWHTLGISWKQWHFSTKKITS
jgi:hypothetical protein